MSYGAVSQFFHAANHHQHKLLERNKVLVETYYLYCHTPIALAVLYSTRMLVLNYYVPHIALHHRKHLLAHVFYQCKRRMKEQHFVVAVIIAHHFGIGYAMQILPMRRPSLSFVPAVGNIWIVQILVVRHYSSGYFR